MFNMESDIMSKFDNDSRYGILVDITAYKEFEKARERLGLSASTYLKNLMGKDFTVQVRFKHIDLSQTKIQENNKNE